MSYMNEMINNKNLPIKLCIRSIIKFEMHLHEDNEIILVIEGSITVKTKAGIYFLKQNDLILININELHSLNKTADKNLLLVLKYNIKNYLSLYPKLNKMIFKCNSLSKDIEIQKKCDLIRDHIAKIISELNTKSNGYKFLIASEINLLLRDIVRNFEYTYLDIQYSSSNEITYIKIQNIVKYINQNYTRKISLHEIAEEEKYSVTYMSKFIKKNLGLSFYDYLQKVRMHSACDLMMCSTTSLTEIAYQCGFPNYKSFYLLTKKFFGCTPEEYRNRNGIKKLPLYKKQSNFLNDEFLIIDEEISLTKLLNFIKP